MAKGPGALTASVQSKAVLRFAGRDLTISVIGIDPHTEGNADPIELYRPGLDSLDAGVRSGFLGETIAASYARMGDPVVQ